MAGHARRQSPLEFTAGCGLPLYPKFVEFAASAREWLAREMGRQPETLFADQSLASELLPDSLDTVELVMSAEEALSFPFNEHDFELLANLEPANDGTIGAFVRDLLIASTR